MHFLIALITIIAFVFVFCLGLVKVVWDLSEMSVGAAIVIAGGNGNTCYSSCG
jgi:hypothetical protein